VSAVAGTVALAASESTAPQTPAARAALPHLLAGARAMAPWLLGIAPFGLVIGLSAAQAGVPTMAGWLTGPLIFAGSAQVATIQLLDGGAAPLAVVAAALAINLRLVLYSATMAPHWRGTSRWWQALAAAVLVDPTLAVGVDGYVGAGDRRHGHLRYAGAAGVLFLTWIAAITVGATVGTALPSGLQLELVIPLFLIGEVVPRLRSRASTVAVAAAVVLALAGRWVPLHLGTLFAIAGAIAVALAIEEEPT
jgi:predicted branched-subunit amino acid permease